MNRYLHRLGLVLLCQLFFGQILGQGLLQGIAPVSINTAMSNANGFTISIGQISSNSLQSTTYLFEIGFPHCLNCKSFANNIEELTIEGVVKLYPNPVQSSFTIENVYGKSLTFTLLDLFAREILTGEIPAESTTIHNISSLPIGTYLLIIRDSNTRIIGGHRILRN